MGKLLDEVQTYVPNRRRCTARTFLDTLSEKDRADYDAAVANPGIPTTAIFRALSARGMPGRYEALRKHVVGGCGCE